MRVVVGPWRGQPPSRPDPSRTCPALPHQALRASLLKKYARVRHLLDQLHTKRMSNYEKIELMESIKSYVQVKPVGSARPEEVQIRA